jgi:hypothetical protein
MRAGVFKLGKGALVAASAFVEKNQKALARFGRSVALRATVTNPARKSCEVNVMGKRGIEVGLSSTKMA